MDAPGRDRQRPGGWQCAGGRRGDSARQPRAAAEAPGRRRRRSTAHGLGEDRAGQPRDRHRAPRRDGPRRPFDAGADARRRAGCGLGLGGCAGSAGPRGVRQLRPRQGLCVGRGGHPQALGRHHRRPVSAVRQDRQSAGDGRQLQCAHQRPARHARGRRRSAAHAGAGGCHGVAGANHGSRPRKLPHHPPADWSHGHLRRVRRRGRRRPAAGQAAAEEAGTVPLDGDRGATVGHPGQGGRQRRFRHRCPSAGVEGGDHPPLPGVRRHSRRGARGRCAGSARRAPGGEHRRCRCRGGRRLLGRPQGLGRARRLLGRGRQRLRDPSRSSPSSPRR